MNRFVLLVGMLALFCVACQSTSQVLWQGGDPLQSGWTMAGPGEFVVEGLELKTQGGMGLLWYDRQEFEDFRLDLEWKVTEAGNNSGVFVRFPKAGNDPWIAVNGGYEVQICDTADEIHRTGAIYSFQASTEVPTRPVGEWNHYSIQVVGQHYTIKINGVVVNEFEGDRNLVGYVGLQNHDEHSTVRFRNIRVTEL